MNTTSSSVTQPPPLQINSEPSALLRLPIEIKVLIVKLINDQDTAFWTRTEEEEMPPAASCWGRSLNSMFLVNQEFSELAALHIFKTIPVSITKNSTFKYIALRRRAHLVKTLHYSLTKTSDKEAFSDSVTWIDSLPNLNELTIVQNLHWIKHHEESYQYQVFTSIAPRIKRLIINVQNDAEAFITLGLLRIFLNVEELELGLHASTSFTSVLQQAICGLVKLRKLNTVINSEAEDSTGLVFPSTLTHINVRLLEDDISITSRLSWLQQLPNLKHLTIKYDGLDNCSFLPSLPSLTSLYIQDSSALVILITLESLKLSPISHLQISHSQGFFSSDNYKPYRELLNQFTHLNHLSVQQIYDNDNDLDLIHFYQKLASESKYQVDIPSTYFMKDFSSRSIIPEAQGAMMDLASKEFYEILEYGKRRMKRLVKDQDLKGGQELAATILAMRDLWFRDEKD